MQDKQTYSLLWSERFMTKTEADLTVSLQKDNKSVFRNTDLFLKIKSHYDIYFVPIFYNSYFLFSTLHIYTPI